MPHRPCWVARCHPDTGPCRPESEGLHCEELIYGILVLPQYTSFLCPLAVSSHFLSRKLHSFHNVFITGAAAVVSVDGFANFLVGGILVVAEVIHHRHEEAGRAETALQRMFFMEGFLDRMQVLRSAKRFHRLDFVPVGHHREHDAGTNRLTVKKNGACAAQAVLAPDVRAGKAEIMADEVAQ